MDRAFVACCASFSTALPNWNGAFQAALDLEDATLALATRRQTEIYRVERAFEAAAVQGATRIVTMAEAADAPRPLQGHHQCFRHGNIFYRVLPDSRSGRNYVASLRGILQSGSRLLTVPLSCVFYHRGTPVLAQALAPIPSDAQKLFGDDIAQPNFEVEAEVEVVADALNTPLPDHPVMETYRGLDGRCYVTHTNIATIALDDATLIDGPVKRAEMLALCPCVTATCEDTLNVLRNPAVVAALLQICSTAGAAAMDQQQLLCDTLHFYGVNLCLLKGVLDAVRAAAVASGEEWEVLKFIVATEMIARTAKQEFNLEAQAKRLGMDAVGVGRCLGLQLRAALDATEGGAGFMQALLRKYAIANVDGEDEEIIAAVQTLRRGRAPIIVERASLLIGARAGPPPPPSTTPAPSPASRWDTNGSCGSAAASSGSVVSSTNSARRTIAWMPRVGARVAPRLCDPKMLCSLKLLYAPGAVTNEEHHLAFGTPVCIRVAQWEGRFADALALARAAVEANRSKYGPLSLRCLRATATLCRLLYSDPTIESVSEASGRLVELLDGLERWESPITSARLHVDVGCWLLGAAHVVDTVAEACQHFLRAAQLLPDSLRSPHGSWLFVQPRLGLLRCRQIAADMNGGGRQGAAAARALVPVLPLTADALYLGRAAAPSDGLVEYLWELGMELATDGHFKEATEALTMAVGLGKRVEASALDLKALRRNTLDVYRAWDPVKYTAYCNSLEGTRA